MRVKEDGREVSAPNSPGNGCLAPETCLPQECRSHSSLRIEKRQVLVSSCLRMRRLRERRRAGGTRVFPVEVGIEAMEFLIQQGLLSREASAYPLAVGVALQEALTEWAQTR
jgi:hypothetical protein